MQNLLSNMNARGRPMENKHWCPAGKCECELHGGINCYARASDPIHINPAYQKAIEVCMFPSKQKPIAPTDTDRKNDCSLCHGVGSYFSAVVFRETPCVCGAGTPEAKLKLDPIYVAGFIKGEQAMKEKCVTTLQDLYCQLEHGLDESIRAIQAIPVSNEVKDGIK